MKPNKLRLLPLGYSDFSEVINRKCVYVDKTKLIYQMISTGKYYFLSRPRRFGKSLLISTLNSLFLNKRDLFKNLWIDSSDYDWKAHPVIRFNFSLIAHRTVSDLINAIDIRLDTIAKQNKLKIPRNYPIENKFESLIAQLGEREKVAILIDEYDKPILDHIDNPHEASVQRDVLKNFYAIIKDSDEHIQFALLTGVSKFSKTSIFSGINNLRDITLSGQYADLLGYTHQELVDYFEPYINILAKSYKKSANDIVQDLKNTYDGYKFSPQNICIFNPYSILSCFAEHTLDSYWFATGTPTFLINLIRKNEYPLSRIYNPTMRASDLDAFEPDNIEITALLYQTGYLTIKERAAEGAFTLDFPNLEVADGFNLSLSKAFSGLPHAITGSYAKKIWQTFVDNDMVGLEKVLQAFFDEMTYDTHIKKEYDLKLLLFCVFKLIGIEVSPEVKTSRGIADLVIELPGYVYVIELKFDKTAQEALAQIQDMKYYAAYINSGKRIILAGINFEKSTKTVAVLTQEPVETPKI